ncbi:universal stress protein [Pseudozobellia thermophila]|uniref:Nucleotide-binding universal stress protein, UspA family n=1 Tax=Pseudozobellia thermophila TaxID=192903 RepID=A0A1M6IM70_9FLAO|nr:universal stress protein [Pseudozobellia thermophila]SHJ35473.1 Nucleotide-binding universal stress protein, UspA family [Pseudozobellia thermophila]
MKKILLPTDFSNNAWNAIFTAVKLYTDVKCRFYLLHAYEPGALNLLGRKGQQRLGVLYDSLSEYSRQELDKVMDYLDKNHHNPKHSFEPLSKSDTLEEAVEGVIAEKDIDLVCMGTQGATGAKKVFMGSNTVKVLNKINNTPVLVVPDEYDFKRLKSLALPTDFTKKYEKYQLLPLTELASLWNTNVQVVHVAIEFALNDQQLVNQKLLKERLNDLEVTFYNIDFEIDVAHTLEKFAQDIEVDMLALIRYHHSFWEKIIGEPVVKKMTFHAKVPLLVLPE